MPGIIDYLNKLDSDVNAKTAHNQNPNNAMHAFGLTVEEQAAILSGNSVTVATLIGISPQPGSAIDSVEIISHS